MKFIKSVLFTTTLLTMGLAVPSARGAFNLTTLVSFANTNGANPEAGLIKGSDGNFYGTTYGLGTSNFGTIFKVTANGALTTLVSLANSNGATPVSPLVQGNDGNFYGTTRTGGSSNYGTVFKVTSNGVFTTLVSFTNGNGQYPQYGGLKQGSDGDFYGTTSSGGSSGVGTFFKVTTNGVLTPLYSFLASTPNASQPLAGVIQAADGSFYGTTQSGGTSNKGTVFNITTNGTLTTVVSFVGNNGSVPQSDLTRGSDGNFYGTTIGGNGGGANTDFGTVFRLTTNGVLTTLASFGYTNGWLPGRLTQAGDGDFYGTTQSGGSDNKGTIFKVTTNGVLTLLFSFEGTNNGTQPFGGVTQGSDGSFYGTTYAGGSNGLGTVFRLAFISDATAPVILSVTQSNNVIAFTWSAVLGRMYQPQYNTNLGSSNWLNLGSVVTATNSVMATSHVIGPDTQRFYRVVLLP